MLNDNKIKEAINDSSLHSKLKIERSISLAIVAAAIFSGFLMLYASFGEERLELVYMEQNRFDAPTFLPKVRDSKDEIKAERWVRGFKNRFIKYYFIHKDDSDSFAKDALSWLHAHSSAKGQNRSESLIADFKQYTELRKSQFVSFFSVNDESTVKIRESKDDNTLIFVEVPGTYIVYESGAEAFQNAILKLVIRKVPITGKDSGYGTINASGLIVEDGFIEYVEDLVRPEERFKQPLF